MASVSLGENSKLTVNPAERDRVRRFYKEVLGCPSTKESERIDIFPIGTNFFLGVVYDDSTLSASDSLKSIWLDLRTDHPDDLKQKIVTFGIKGIDFWDKEHFYLTRSATRPLINSNFGGLLQFKCRRLIEIEPVT